MYTIQLQNEKVYRRLLEAARQRGVSIDEVLDDLLDQPGADVDDGNPILQMAAAAEKANLIADREDISEHFDEILRQSWGKDDSPDKPAD